VGRGGVKFSRERRDEREKDRRRRNEERKERKNGQRQDENKRARCDYAPLDGGAILYPPGSCADVGWQIEFAQW
jgi:hypothetical protein